MAVQPAISLPGGQNQASANSSRMAGLAERLACHFQPGRQSDNMEFVACCINLASVIDNAVANNEVPAKAPDLPVILKQVCQRRHNGVLVSVIMLLMISVKKACKLGWFPENQSQELLALADEIGGSFGITKNVTPEPRTLSTTVSMIMSRFYPFVRMGHILASLELKPGNGAYVVDVHIAKNVMHSPQEHIRLFVAQIDNIDTSACLVTPQQASFLINGAPVVNRSNVLMEPGPQLPTIVTGFLKYGANLFQAVGQFGGCYVVILAFMSVLSPPDEPGFQDYVQPGIGEQNKDSDIIEGPSRISLNCPISRSRIKLPVKGHLCRHLQCFDYGNYIDINSRRPAWRCPHCNQSVSYTDIRIDRNIVKVLKDVGGDVANVIISAEGTWIAAMEMDEHVDKVHDKEFNLEEHSSSSGAVMDLTGDDKEADIGCSVNVEDIKPVITDLLSQFSATSSVLPANEGHIAGNDQNSAAQGDDFWSRVLRSLDPSPANHMTSPVLTDAISPAINEGSDFHGNTSPAENQLPGSVNIPLDHLQMHNQNANQEYSSLARIQRDLTRLPTAVEALPVPSQVPSPQQRPNGPHFSSQANPSDSAVGNSFNRASINRASNTNPSRIAPAAVPSPQHRSTIQNWSPQDLVRMQQSRSLSPSLLRPPSSVPLQTQMQQVIGQTVRPSIATSMSQQIQNPRPGPPHPGSSMVQAVSRPDELMDVNSDTAWRPPGRMRGSLVPGAYSRSIDQLIIRPSQSPQMSRPPMTQPSGHAPRPQPHLFSDLQVLLDRRSSGMAQVQNTEPIRPPGFNGPPGSR